MIRTVDSTRVFIGKSNSTNRSMKIENLLTNCTPNQIDRDAVAMIRSKMSRLVMMEHYDETMRDTGLRRMKTKLEIRTPCYTGLPKSVADKKTLPSGMRYTRREIFRLTNKVVDNQVVTECYLQKSKNKGKTIHQIFLEKTDDLFQVRQNSPSATMIVWTILPTHS